MSAATLACHEGSRRASLLRSYSSDDHARTQDVESRQSFDPILQCRSLELMEHTFSGGWRIIIRSWVTYGTGAAFFLVGSCGGATSRIVKKEPNNLGLRRRPTNAPNWLHPPRTQDKMNNGLSLSNGPGTPGIGARATRRSYRHGYQLGTAVAQDRHSLINSSFSS